MKVQFKNDSQWWPDLAYMAQEQFPDALIEVEFSDEIYIPSSVYMDGRLIVADVAGKVFFYEDIVEIVEKHLPEINEHMTLVNQTIDRLNAYYHPMMGPQ